MQNPNRQVKKTEQKVHINQTQVNKLTTKTRKTKDADPQFMFWLLWLLWVVVLDVKICSVLCHPRKCKDVLTLNHSAKTNQNNRAKQQSTPVVFCVSAIRLCTEGAAGCLRCSLKTKSVLLLSAVLLLVMRVNGWNAGYSSLDTMLWLHHMWRCQCWQRVFLEGKQGTSAQRTQNMTDPTHATDEHTWR